MSSRVVPSRTSSRITSHSASRLRGSRPVVGSSRNSTCGSADQAGAQVEPAPHAAGVGLDRAVGGVGEVEPLEQLLARVAGPRARRQVVEPADQVEVLAAGEVLVDGGVLAGEADHAAQRLGSRTTSLPATRAGPVGHEQGGEDPHGGGLAGPVGAEQAQDRGRAAPAGRRPSASTSPNRLTRLSATIAASVIERAILPTTSTPPPSHPSPSCGFNALCYADPPLA